MAEHASDHTHGEMDILQQQNAFEGFMRMTKWGSLAVAVIVLFATLTFCTDAGVGTGALLSLILLVLGVFFLRDKPGHAAAH
jgi:hypothetical protein